MKRRNWFGIFLIVAGILLILAFIILFFFFRPKDTQVVDSGSGLPEIPFGTNEIPVGGIDPITGDPIETPVSVQQPRDTDEDQDPLVQITNYPTNGFRVFSTEREVLGTKARTVEIELDDGEVFFETVVDDVITTVIVPRVRHNDADNGYVYDALLDDHEVVAQLVLDQPISGIHEVDFSSQDTIVYRYFDDTEARIKTYHGQLISNQVTASCPFIFADRFEVGASGREIELIQRYLRDYSTPPLPMTPAVFDDAMYEAVIAFQKTYGLNPDGVIGTAVNEKIQAFCLEEEKRSLAAELAERNDAPYILSGDFIDDDMAQFAYRPDTDAFFGLIENEAATRGYVYQSSSLDRNEIYNLDFSDWLVEWPSAQYVTLTSKASGVAQGHLFTLDATTGDLTKIVGDVRGFTTLPNGDVTRALYSRTTSNDGFEFGVLDMVRREFGSLGVTTFPEKCTWASDHVTVYCAVPEFIPANLYPDRWYQEQVSFTDDLWEINTQTGAIRVIENFNAYNLVPEIEKLMLDPSEQVLFFIDKNTGYIWGRYLDSRQAS